MTINNYGEKIVKFRFPWTTTKPQKRVFGFQTGGLVQVKVVKEKKLGLYSGRVVVRYNGYFNIKTQMGTIQDIHHTSCKLIQIINGYSYKFGNPSKVIPMLLHRSSPEGFSIPPRSEGQVLLEIQR